MLWGEYLDMDEQGGIYIVHLKADRRKWAAGHSYAEAFGRLWLIHEDDMIALVREHAVVPAPVEAR